MSVVAPSVPATRSAPSRDLVGPDDPCWPFDSLDRAPAIELSFGEPERLLARPERRREASPAVVMLQAWDKGILAATLRYASEVRDADVYFGDIPDVPVPADMLQLAEHILETKAARFAPAGFKDR